MVELSLSLRCLWYFLNIICHFTNYLKIFFFYRIEWPDRCREFPKHYPKERRSKIFQVVVLLCLVDVVLYCVCLSLLCLMFYDDVVVIFWKFLGQECAESGNFQWALFFLVFNETSVCMCVWLTSSSTVCCLEFG